MSGINVFNRNKYFNDSRELVKMPTHYGRHRRANPYSKLKPPTANANRAFRLTPNRRFTNKLKHFSSSRKVSARKSTPKKSNEWQQEYDIWTMMTQTLDQHLLTNHKIVWENKEIGIRDSTDKIRLIENRQQLNEMIFVNSDGKRTHAKDLINPNESNSNIALRIKFRLVPVMQGFTVVDDTKTESFIIANDDEKNNNDIECENKQTNWDDSERTLTSDGEVDMDSDEDIDKSCDETITNVSAVGDYSDFVDGLLGRSSASSTLIADKENIPVYPSPTKADSRSRSITFFDSPIPKFAQKRNISSNRFENKQLDACDIRNICKSLKKLNSKIRRALFKIEDVCAQLIENVSSTVSISGIGLLSDSILI